MSATFRAYKDWKTLAAEYDGAKRTVENIAIYISDNTDDPRVEGLNYIDYVHHVEDWVFNKIVFDANAAAK